MDVQIKKGVPKDEKPDQIADIKKQQADLTFQLMIAGVI